MLLIQLLMIDMKLFRPRDKVLIPLGCILVGTLALFPNSFRNLVNSTWDFIGQVITAPPSYDYWRESGPQVGEEAPEIVGTSLSGDTIRLSDFRGNIVFLNFWTDT